MPRHRQVIASPRSYCAGGAGAGSVDGPKYSPLQDPCSPDANKTKTSRTFVRHVGVLWFKEREPRSPGGM
eukprot:2479057-Pyramimonas_sp.AAC.1